MQNSRQALVKLAAVPFFFVFIAVFGASTPVALLASLAALLSLALLMIWLARKPSTGPASPGRAANFPLAAEMELTSALHGDNAERRRDVLHQVIMQGNQDADLVGLSLLLTACGARIQSALPQSQAGPFGESTALGAANSHQELFETACALFDALAAAVREQRQHPALSEKMLAFVDDNFHRNIALTNLAEHLNLTPNYVSTLFRNEIGSNFKEYLNRRRFAHAAALLETNRRVKIKDVAEQSGCSVDILGRLFLRYSGVSPQEYRRRHASGVRL